MLEQNIQHLWGLLLMLQKSMPYLLNGAVVTIGAVVCSMFLGLLLGVPLALLQVYGKGPFRWFANFYVWFFRGIPILVFLYLFEMVLASHKIVPFAVVCLVLGMTSAAYQSQIFRGSILALPAGQLKAACALGMSDFQAIRSIILPQALRMSIAAWSNEYSILLKDSALASVIGANELMARGHALASRTSEYVAFYCVVALLYLFMTVIGVKLLRRVEKRVHIPGYASV